MQVNTLTITVENQKVGKDLFRITSYEMKVSAFCDCCDVQATGTEKSLKDSGWELLPTCQFCPNCND